MKKILLLLALLIPTILKAQGLDPNKIVQWTFNLVHIEANDYELRAEATIEKPFHIFHTNAGGDGTLINTEITLDDAKELETEWVSKPTPAVKQFDVIEGDVYWHEQRVVFTKKFQIEQGVSQLTGEVYFQVCDDEKCLAPTTKKFKVKLN